MVKPDTHLFQDSDYPNNVLEPITDKIGSCNLLPFIIYYQRYTLHHSQ